MSIQLLLYGDLKRIKGAVENAPGKPLEVNVSKDENIHTVRDVLERIGVKSEVSHVFVNGRYCGVGKRLKDRDRVGIFPRNMGILFAEIEKGDPISILVQLPQRLKKRFRRSRFMINLPEGSLVRDLLKKLGISEENERVTIILNEEKCVQQSAILKDRDHVKIQVPS